MAKETTIARESNVNPINLVSRRTRGFSLSPDEDISFAIARRGQSLSRRYSGYNGLYQTTETISKNESRNRKRISRAVNNMIIGRR